MACVIRVRRIIRIIGYVCTSLFGVSLYMQIVEFYLNGVSTWIFCKPDFKGVVQWQEKNFLNLSPKGCKNFCNKSAKCELNLKGMFARCLTRILRQNPIDRFPIEMNRNAIQTVLNVLPWI